MNEVERKEFEQRMSALTIEEQILAVKFFEDGVMFSELEKRARKRKAVISVVEKIMEKGVGLDVR